MNSLLVISLCVVGLASAAYNGGQPGGKCEPKQWEGKAVGTIAMAPKRLPLVVLQGKAQVTVDHERGLEVYRWRFNNTGDNDEQSSSELYNSPSEEEYLKVNVYTLYSKGVEFIHYANKGKCIAREIPKTQSRQLCSNQGNMRLIGSLKQPTGGNRDVYAILGLPKMTAQVTFDRNTFIPTQLTLLQKSGRVPQLTSLQYGDVTEGISRFGLPSGLPKDCKKAALRAKMTQAIFQHQQEDESNYPGQDYAEEEEENELSHVLQAVKRGFPLY